MREKSKKPPLLSLSLSLSISETESKTPAKRSIRRVALINITDYTSLTQTRDSCTQSFQSCRSYVSPEVLAVSDVSPRPRTEVGCVFRAVTHSRYVYIKPSRFRWLANPPILFPPRADVSLVNIADRSRVNLFATVSRAVWTATSIEKSAESLETSACYVFLLKKKQYILQWSD